MKGASHRSGSPDPSHKTPRKCLKCNGVFVSRWIGNRLCEKCRRTNEVALEEKGCKVNLKT